MKRLVPGLVLGLGALLNGCSGCSKDPTEGQPAATVGEAVETASAPTTKPTVAAASPDAAASDAAATPTATATAEAKAPEEIPLSPTTGSILFTGSKVGGSHEGAFKKFTGTLTLVPDAVETSKVSVDIDLASVWTDNGKLTDHLKSEDFFNVGKYTKATFRSTSIKASTAKGATHTITGNLDFHGVRKSISFPANITVAEDKVTATAQFSMNRKDFKVAFDGEADYLIKDYVFVRLSVNAPRKK
jgi:polyisoprenoid-binding protein YceI